jgi:hypothetical protein
MNASAYGPGARMNFCHPVKLTECAPAQNVVAPWYLALPHAGERGRQNATTSLAALCTTAQAQGWNTTHAQAEAPPRAVGARDAEGPL